MTCRICSNRRGNVPYEVREMNFGFRDRFVYFQCVACGCLQILDVPQDIGKYYPPGYYSFAQPHAPSGRAGWARGLLRRARDRYTVLGHGALGRALYACWPNPHLRGLIEALFPGDGVKDIGLTPRSRILDVGSGAGEALLQLHAAGFSRILGIDAFLDGDRVYPGGLRILKRTIHEVSGEWDLIMFHHSFEHMADPRETLEATARLLASGGRCLIRLPLLSSWAWEHYGVDWVQLDAPRHFFLHSVDSLGRLARSAHLEVSRIVHDSAALQFYGSELYRRDIPLHPVIPAEVQARATAFTPEQLAEFEAQARVLNAEGRGDQAAFYLRKSPQ